MGEIILFALTIILILILYIIYKKDENNNFDFNAYFYSRFNNYNNIPPNYNVPQYYMNNNQFNNNNYQNQFNDKYYSHNIKYENFKNNEFYQPNFNNTYNKSNNKSYNNNTFEISNLKSPGYVLNDLNSTQNKIQNKNYNNYNDIKFGEFLPGNRITFGMNNDSNEKYNKKNDNLKVIYADEFFSKQHPIKSNEKIDIFQSTDKNKTVINSPDSNVSNFLSIFKSKKTTENKINDKENININYSNKIETNLNSGNLLENLIFDENNNNNINNIIKNKNSYQINSNSIKKKLNFGENEE